MLKITKSITAMHLSGPNGKKTKGKMPLFNMLFKILKMNKQKAKSLKTEFSILWIKINSRFKKLKNK